MKKKQAKTVNPRQSKLLKENRISNPWSEQPVKKVIGFAYGQEYSKGPLKIKHDEQNKHIDQQIVTMKNQYDFALNNQKEMLYAKYREHFQIPRKMAQVNKIIAFFDAVDRVDHSKVSSLPLCTSYVKVPCEAQTTFLKLFYRIARQQTLSIQPYTVEQQYERLLNVKNSLKEKLFMQ